MATISFKGIDEYIKKIETLELKERDEVIGAAVYKGAGIAAKALKEAIEALPTDGGLGSSEHPLIGPNRIQKKALLDSFGITPMRNDNGFVNVKLGFDGYNSIKTKRWPKGQPNAMIARSVERGTTFMYPNKFIQKTVRRINKQVVGEMQTVVDEKINAIMK